MWTPKIFGHCTRDSRESSISILGWVLAWCVSGVNDVTDDFRADINRELSFSHRDVAGGRGDLLILDSSLLWRTVSNAADKSTATQTVRTG